MAKCKFRRLVAFDKVVIVVETAVLVDTADVVALHGLALDTDVVELEDTDVLEAAEVLVDFDLHHVIALDTVVVDLENTDYLDTAPVAALDTDVVELEDIDVLDTAAVVVEHNFLDVVALDKVAIVVENAALDRVVVDLDDTAVLNTAAVVVDIDYLHVAALDKFVIVVENAVLDTAVLHEIALDTVVVELEDTAGQDTDVILKVIVFAHTELSHRWVLDPNRHLAM